MQWELSYIAKITDPGSFDRGLQYAELGHIKHLRRLADGSFTAQVLGTDLYDVRLGLGDGTCTCPMGEDGVFCKHCVAVALLAAEQDADEVPANIQSVVAWLDTLDREALIELVVDAADISEEFDTHLTLRAARSTGDLTGLRAEIDSRLRSRGGLLWRESDQFAREADPVVEAVCQLVDDGRATEAIPLLQRSIGHLTEVIRRSDDSSGMIGALIRQLLEYHAVACRKAPPAPKDLVRWMVKYGIDDQDWFTIDVDQYADALGPRGLTAYRKEVLRRFEAGDTSFAVRRARERLAIVDGDKSSVIELFGGDLTTAYQFNRVAEALREMGLLDDALGFALRGIDTGKDWRARELYDFAIVEYGRRGDHQSILELRRRELETFPDHTSFTRLRDAAEVLGCWPTERVSALKRLEKIPREFVLSLLDEDADAAWAAASKAADRVSTDLWLRLAEQRELTRPIDVLPVYRAAIDNVLIKADRKNYETAMKLLKRMGRAAHAAGDTHREAFAQYVKELRELHRRRPSFIAILGRG